jgi:hypothetical protein
MSSSNIGLVIEMPMLAAKNNEAENSASHEKCGLHQYLTNCKQSIHAHCYLKITDTFDFLIDLVLNLAGSSSIIYKVPIATFRS